MRQIKKTEAGAQVFINSADAEECVDRDWAEARPGGGYALTDKGRVLLKELGEVGSMSSSK